MDIPEIKINRKGFNTLNELQEKCTSFPKFISFKGNPKAVAVLRKNHVSLGHKFNYKNKRETKVWATTRNIHPRDYAARIAEIHADIINNDNYIILVPTLQEFYDEIVAPYSENLKDSQGFKTHLKPLLSAYSNKSLSEFQKQWISTLLAEQAKRVKPPTQARYLARWQRFFNLAIAHGYIDRNPCTGIPKPKENPPRDRFLTTPELDALIEAALNDSNPIHAGCILLCLFTGLRQGNVRELKLSWFRNNNTELSIPDSKSGKPIHIALNTIAQSIVKRGLAYSDGIYLFPARNSTALRPRYMSKPSDCMKRLRSHVQSITKILEHFHCHDLRTTHSSQMVQLTRDIRLCQQTLGHADIKTTQRYTYHANPELLAASELTATTLLGGRNLEDFNLTNEESTC